MDAFCTETLFIPDHVTTRSDIGAILLSAANVRLCRIQMVSYTIVPGPNGDAWIEVRAQHT